MDATEAALNAGRNYGCRTILDFESGDLGRMRSLLALGTDPILPLGTASRLTGRNTPEEVVRALADLSQGLAIVTDGIKGSWACDFGSVAHQPVFSVQSIDSTGCGDAYHAGYIVGILEGWKLDLRMEFAALLAAKVATQIGGRTALPWRCEILTLLRPDVSAGLREAVRKLYDKTPVNSG